MRWEARAHGATCNMGGSPPIYRLKSTLDFGVQWDYSHQDGM